MAYARLLLGVLLSCSYISESVSERCQTGSYIVYCSGSCCIDRCCDYYYNPDNSGVIIAIILTVAMSLALVAGVVIVCYVFRPRVWGVPITPGAAATQIQPPVTGGDYHRLA